MAGILATFAADPDAALTVADIAMSTYGVELRQVTKKHRVAVLRAMRRVCEVEPRFGLMNGEGPEGQMVVYDRTRVLSYGLARFKADWLERYQWRVPRGCKPPESEEELRARLALADGDDIDREHYRELLSEGGAWWRHCRLAQAEMAGDHATVLRLREREEVEYRAMLKVGLEMFGPARPRPAPVRPGPDEPDPPWDDEAAWRALWNAAEFKSQLHDLTIRRARAAGCTVRRWAIDVPRELLCHREMRWLEGWAYGAGFKAVCCVDRARGEAA